MAKEKKPEAGVPAWVMTFGDCMSLLLCFFVLMMTFSTLDADKLLDVMGGFKAALGLKKSPIPIKPNPNAIIDSREEEEDELDTKKSEKTFIPPDQISPVSLKTINIHNKFNEYRRKITEVGFKGFITIREINEGIQVLIPSNQLFSTGSTRLKRDAITLLQGFSNICHSVGNEIRVCGSYNLALSVSAKKINEEKKKLTMKRIQTIALIFETKFNLGPTRIGYSVQGKYDKKPDDIRLLLVEKFGTNIVKMKDLLNMNKI